MAERAALELRGRKVQTLSVIGSHPVGPPETWLALKVLPVESFHLDGAYPDMCAKVVAEFLKEDATS